MAEPAAGAVTAFERELDRLRSELKSNIYSEVGALQKLLETRFEYMDSRLDRAEKFPTDLDLAKSELSSLFNEKLRSQQELFDEKIKGLEALLAEQRESAKEAIEKSEGATDKQLASTTGLITAVTSRLDKGEGQAAGAARLYGGLIAAAVLVVGIIGLILTRSPDDPVPRYIPVPQQQPQPPVVEERR